MTPILDRYGAVLWFVVIATLAGLYGYHRQDQLTEIGRQFALADLRWVVIAILAQFVVLALVARTYQTLLRRLGHGVACFTLAIVHLHRIVVGAIAPASGPASLYVFVRHLRRRGVSADDALLAAALRSVAAYGAFTLMLIPALLLHRPSRLTMFGGLLLVILFGAIVWVSMMLLRGGKLHHRWHRLAPRRAREFAERARGHGIRPVDLLSPMGLALAVRIGGAAILYAALRSVGQDPSITVPLVAYIVGILFMMVTPVFGGAGVVEVSTAVALERLGIPVGAAVGASILARLAEFWLPLALGIVVHLAMAAYGGFATLGRRTPHRQPASGIPSERLQPASPVATRPALSRPVLPPRIS